MASGAASSGDATAEGMQGGTSVGWGMDSQTVWCASLLLLIRSWRLPRLSTPTPWSATVRTGCSSCWSCSNSPAQDTAKWAGADGAAASGVLSGMSVLVVAAALAFLFALMRRLCDARSFMRRSTSSKICSNNSSQPMGPRGSSPHHRKTKSLLAPGNVSGGTGAALGLLRSSKFRAHQPSPCVHLLSAVRPSISLRRRSATFFCSFAVRSNLKRWSASPSKELMPLSRAAPTPRRSLPQSADLAAPLQG